MLRVFMLLVVALPAAWPRDAAVPPRGPLTLVVEYETAPAPESLTEMRKELSGILEKTGLQVEWKLRSEIKLGDSLNDLAVIRLRGNCRMEAMPVVFDERGPLAFAHTTDGEILPFTEVVCDRVRGLTRSAMFGGEHARGNQLLGRAMARVVAHELYHVVAGEHQHDKEGITRSSLSGRQLIADHLDFSDKAAGRMPAKSR